MFFRMVLLNVTMVTRTVSFALGEYYHIYNRGVEKRSLFLDAQDHASFLQRMYILNDVDPISIRDIKKNKEDIYAQERHEPLVSIGAYCLMPNHFHILLTPRIEGGVSTYMNKLGTSYTMYFNTRYERSGRLYEGSYKAKFIDTDQYLKYLFAYIHLNPQKLAPQGTDPATFLAQYAYSSLPDHLGKSRRRQSSILSPEMFPEYFKTSAEHMDELQTWLAYGKGEYQDH